MHRSGGSSNISSNSNSSSKRKNVLAGAGQAVASSSDTPRRKRGGLGTQKPPDLDPDGTFWFKPQVQHLTVNMPSLLLQFQDHMTAAEEQEKKRAEKQHARNVGKQKEWELFRRLYTRAQTQKNEVVNSKWFSDQVSHTDHNNVYQDFVGKDFVLTPGARQKMALAKLQTFEQTYEKLAPSLLPETSSGGSKDAPAGGTAAAVSLTSVSQQSGDDLLFPKPG